MKYKLSLPGAYTLLIRLAGLRAVAIYLYTNFVVPALLTLAMRSSLSKEMLAELLGSWILIHLVYEIGYFMNDFFAADVRNNWRKIPSLDSKSTNVILLVKIGLVILYAFLCKSLEWTIISAVLFLTYLAHNYLQKAYRITTFILLRILKFAPFIYLSYEVNLDLLTYFLIFALIEGFKSYYGGNTDNSWYRWTYYIPGIVFLPDTTLLLLSVFLVWFPRLLLR